MGHPLLRETARPLDSAEIDSPWMRALVADMTDTLVDYGGIGLAAPQVAEPVRLAIIETSKGASRYGDVPEMSLTVFVNPCIEVLDMQTAGYWEGCLSIPGLRGFVERPQHIRVEYLDGKGRLQMMELKGFLATVFQHEFDHLDGKLYVDRITDTRLLSFDQEYERYLLPEQTI